MAAMQVTPNVGDVRFEAVRFERREQIVMVLTEDWPNSDDSQLRASTRDREILLAEKTEPVHEKRVTEAVGAVQSGRHLWEQPT